MYLLVIRLFQQSYNKLPPCISCSILIINTTQKKFAASIKLTWATQKNKPYFPFNPGWFIGALIIASYDPYITWIGFHPLALPSIQLNRPSKTSVQPSCMGFVPPGIIFCHTLGNITAKVEFCCIQMSNSHLPAHISTGDICNGLKPWVKYFEYFEVWKLKPKEGFEVEYHGWSWIINEPPLVTHCSNREFFGWRFSPP